MAFFIGRAEKLRTAELPANGIAVSRLALKTSVNSAMRGAFADSETFDFGVDLGSPVSLD